MTTATRPDRRARETLAALRADPRLFARAVVGMEAYPKQRDILRAVGSSRRVAVVGANGSGKDFTAGRIIAWWVATHYPAKALVLGPTYRQVDAIVWGEFRQAYQASGGLIGGQMYETPRWRRNDEHWAMGFATDKAYNIQGFHSPHLLVVITEAHAMRQDHIEAAKRLNPELIVMTGNPFVLLGEFYDAFHGRRDLYETVQISAYDTPNCDPVRNPEGRVLIPGAVTLRDVEERKREWGETNALFVASVLGQFPDALDDAITSLAKAQAAAARTLASGLPSVVAVDVGRFGADRTVVVHRRGPVARIVWRDATKDTFQVAEWVHGYLSGDGKDARAVVIDDVGVGGGVTDALRSPKSPYRLRGVRLIPFQGGASAADPTRYANAVSEVWLLMGRALNADALDIERDANLISQVATRQYAVQADRRLRVQSKEDMRPTDRMALATWSSPDEADALAMTFAPAAALAGPAEVRVAGKESTWRTS